jgi:hypothetical protein
MFANFRRKNWRLSQSQCYEQIFAKTSCSVRKKRQFFAKKLAKIFF